MQNINYNTIFSSPQSSEMITPEDLRTLQQCIVNGQTPQLRGVTYSTSQVFDFVRRAQAGERPLKTSPYVLDFFAEQGARMVITPPKPEELQYHPKVTLEPVDAQTVIKEANVKENNGMLDAQGISVGGKRYKYSVALKEDLSIFATYVKVDLMDNKPVWAGVIQPKGPYNNLTQYRPIPFSMLEHHIPPKKMKGMILYEYLIEHPEYHKMVRTAVAYMFEDLTVPVMDDNGKPLVEDGVKVLQYANAMKTFDSHSELKRLYRPPPMNFKIKPGYGGAKYINTMMTQISRHFLNVNNAYYDGIDASINRDSIRSKLEIINRYAEYFPDEVIIITGIEEEGIVTKALLEMHGKSSFVMTERAASNIQGFKIWMDPKNIEDNIAIGDKKAVTNIIAKDGAMLRAVYANKYAHGFGFMTNMIVYHYDQKNMPTSTAATDKYSECCLVGEYMFKQLPSAKPLHYYPYIFLPIKEAEKYPGTNEQRLIETWRHMWTLLSWPLSKRAYIVRYFVTPVAISYRKGKGILDLTLEDEEQKEIVQQVRLLDEQQGIKGHKIVGEKQRIKVDDPPPLAPATTRIIPRNDARVPPPTSGPKPHPSSFEPPTRGMTERVIQNRPLMPVYLPPPRQEKPVDEEESLDTIPSDDED